MTATHRRHDPRPRGSGTLLVTGGAGFIGSALVRHLIHETDYRVVNADKLTYAGNLNSLAPVDGHPRHVFERVDICDGSEIQRLFREYHPCGVLHLAAESHVDRSIDGPGAFVQTNLVGTYTLLQNALAYWRDLEGPEKEGFRFLHVSTDEVYGSLGEVGSFTERSPYDPSSPYSASKAGADHLVRAWHRTFGLPVLITNCSNNYGPCQFPEKLIPLAILRALEGDPIPVYGEGRNVRDWLFVDDHVDALVTVLEGGSPGETYNIGGQSERMNLEVVRSICEIMDELRPGSAPHSKLIAFVPDRPGHDLRYAMDTSRIREELGWTPRETFPTGLRRTVEWYLDHLDWCER